MDNCIVKHKQISPNTFSLEHFQGIGSCITGCAKSSAVPYFGKMFYVKVQLYFSNNKCR